MRDDDLSIPVLADILEPGDPAKADAGVSRRHVDHAWTDALIRDAHAEPLGAVPMLNDILVPGDPARAQHVPQPAGAGLTIPLLTEVLSYPEAHEDRLHHETAGAPIPLLTDVIADFDDVEDGSEAAEPAAAAAGEAREAAGQTDKEAVSEGVQGALHETPEAVVQEAAWDATHEAGLEPAATELETTVEARAEAQAEPLEEEAPSEAPSAEAFAFEVDDVPLLTDVFTDEVAPVEQAAAPVWHEETGAEEPVAALELESGSESRSELLPEPESELKSAAEPVSRAPMDLSALASSIEANLLDSELPFRAYCAFPGEPALTALDVGDSAVPPSWPMAKVPQPFGSGEPPELPAPDSTVPETFADEATSAHAVIEPESPQADEVSTHPVPFEPIATEVLPEADLPQALHAEPAPEPVQELVQEAAQDEGQEVAQEAILLETTQPRDVQPEAAQSEAVHSEALQPEAVQPEVTESETVAPAMAEAEADHLASMLAHPEPVAAELSEPQPEYLSDLALVPAQVEIDHVAADVRARALRYLASEGHALIESRCQEQAIWLAHRITREIAATLEREIGQWVQDALNDALTKRLPPR